MGVTIHYSGHLREPLAYGLLIGEVQDFAEQQSWPHRLISKSGATLERWDQTGREWTVRGDTRGIELLPHDWCEPLTLEFDREHFVQDFTKTQYAPPEIHVAIVELFQHLAPFFRDLDVSDEGEYWESGDLDRLRDMFDECFQALHDALAENPEARGPIRLEGGRIADIIE